MKNRATSDRLKLALKQAGLKAKELSDRSGVSKSSISQYVNGLYIPSNINAGAMAKVLGVNPLWLMGFEVPMHIEEIRPYYSGQVTISDLSIHNLIKEDEKYSFHETQEVHEGIITYIVKDDSMAPEFKKGDVLIVDKNCDAVPGDYVIAEGRLTKYSDALDNILGKIIESRRFF